MRPWGSNWNLYEVVRVWEQRVTDTLLQVFHSKTLKLEVRVKFCHQLAVWS